MKRIVHALVALTLLLSVCTWQSAPLQAAPALVTEATVLATKDAHIIAVLTDVAEKVFISEYDDGSESIRNFFLTQDSTLRFSCDVFIDGSKQGQLKAGETMRFGDYSDGGGDGNSTVYISDKFATSMYFETIAAYPVYAQNQWGKMKNLSAYLTDEPFEVTPEQAPADIYRFVELTGSHSSPDKHFIYQSPNGHITDVRANADEEAVQIVTYDAAGTTLSRKTIPFELPLFGTFFRGHEFIYMVFGQSNPDEDDSQEIYRIVKYDDDLKRLGAASIFSAEATAVRPFNSGTAKLAERDGELTLHTSRLLYRTTDGLRHQVNFTAVIDIETMKAEVNSRGTTAERGYNAQQTHVSHSFDQYVLYDRDATVLLDLGDGYPRAVVLQLAEKAPPNDLYFEAGELLTNPYIMYDIPGPIGANYTGVAVGGFVLSESHYLAAFNSIDLAKIDDWYKQSNSPLNSDMIPTNRDELDSNRSVFIAALPKTVTDPWDRTTRTDSAKQIMIANYGGSDKTAGRPQLVAHDDGSYTVVWEQFTVTKTPSRIINKDFDYAQAYDCTVAQKIDSSGKPVGGQQSYEDRSAFFMEYFGIDFFPDVPEFSTTIIAEEPTEQPAEVEPVENQPEESRPGQGQADQLPSPSQPEREQADLTPQTATPTASQVLVDGEAVDFEAYNIAGSNYFKLRDLAWALRHSNSAFSVGFDGERNAIVLISGETSNAASGPASLSDPISRTALPSTQRIFLDGSEIALDAYNIAGSNYFKLRDIGTALGFSVGWDADRNTIAIDTSQNAAASSAATELQPSELNLLADLERYILAYDAGNAVPEATIELIVSSEFTAMCRRYVVSDGSFAYKTDEHGTWRIIHHVQTEVNGENFGITLRTNETNERRLLAEAYLRDGKFTGGSLMTYDRVDGTTSQSFYNAIGVEIHPYSGKITSHRYEPDR